MDIIRSATLQPTPCNPAVEDDLQGRRSGKPAPNPAFRTKRRGRRVFHVQPPARVTTSSTRYGGADICGVLCLLSDGWARVAEMTPSPLFSFVLFVRAGVSCGAALSRLSRVISDVAPPSSCPWPRFHFCKAAARATQPPSVIIHRRVHWSVPRDVPETDRRASFVLLDYLSSFLLFPHPPRRLCVTQG